MLQQQLPIEHYHSRKSAKGITQTIIYVLKVWACKKINKNFRVFHRIKLAMFESIYACAQFFNSWAQILIHENILEEFQVLFCCMHWSFCRDFSFFFYPFCSSYRILCVVKFLFYLRFVHFFCSKRIRSRVGGSTVDSCMRWPFLRGRNLRCGRAVLAQLASIHSN